MYELCDVNHGTRSKTYDFFRICHNALRTVLIESVNALKFISDNMFIVLPGRSMALPVYVNGVFSMLEMPDSKVWAIKTTVMFGETTLYTGTQALYKDSLEDIWKDIVKPIDVALDGTEYMFYMDDQGVIKQGIDFYGPGLHRKFMLLGDGGPVIRDVTIVYLFIYILNKLGVVSAAEKFFRMVLTNLSNIHMKRKVAATADLLESMNYDVTSFISEEQLGDTQVLVKLNSIEEKIGLRLLLR